MWKGSAKSGEGIINAIKHLATEIESMQELIHSTIYKEVLTLDD